MRKAEINFYFDYLSPYAYLAWLRVQKLCNQYGCNLKNHPILLAGLLNHWKQLGPAEIPPKREFVFKDTYRFAKTHNIPFRLPKSHPFNPLMPLRLSLKETAGDQQTQVINTLWQASWGQGRDISTVEELTKILDEAQLPTSKLLEKIQDPAIKEKLKSETSDAIAQGVFGVPTFIIDGELFWGNDQLTYLEMHIQGQDPLDLTPAELEFLHSHPRSASRI
ncbi:MAG: 2-hydroxychromene-2-carboxylate isomerase [Deltaproteobacteria bacterium]|nr:2-hydroxychromene-2-carboxylate isomerase [Deltaproteobacteria bacterium]